MNERRIHQVFEVSVLFKGLDGFIECLGGIALIIVSRKDIIGIVNWLTEGELVEDPHDFVANHLLVWAHHFSVSTKAFFAIYLLAHGLIKIFLVAALLRGKMWSYPASLIVLVLFVVYQLYRFAFTHGAGLLALTIFDVFVITLIWHEYRFVREKLAAGRA